MSKFEEVKIDQTTCIQKDGIEIKAFIAGVNSGAYGLPFVIQVRVWARKWIFSKFFYRELKLGYSEMKLLRDELQKAIDYIDKKDR